MVKNNLVKVSENYHKVASKLLIKKDLISKLSEFGEVVLTGAYKYNLMLSPDIDLYVVREKKYSYTEVLQIFNKIVLDKKFRSYFIAGDWDDIRKGVTFPRGYYIGMKEHYKDETWKFDIWLIDKKELKRLQKSEPKEVGYKQKELILRIKDFRNKKNIKLSGLEIYTNVLSGKWENLNTLKRLISKI